MFPCSFHEQAIHYLLACLTKSKFLKNVSELNHKNTNQEVQEELNTSVTLPEQLFYTHNKKKITADGEKLGSVVIDHRRMPCSVETWTMDMNMAEISCLPDFWEFGSLFLSL
jgi:hypothetical protein